MTAYLWCLLAVLALSAGVLVYVLLPSPSAGRSEGHTPEHSREARGQETTRLNPPDWRK